ncbi:MAG: hypothetical protein D6781_12615 [Verrucomicrobia bacterium]|nr:MAG: hypothetical protein D6781_12615 [Verrucomicrobiota bacterium]
MGDDAALPATVTVVGGPGHEGGERVAFTPAVEPMIEGSMDGFDVGGAVAGGGEIERVGPGGKDIAAGDEHRFVALDGARKVKSVRVAVRLEGRGDGDRVA